MTISLGNLLQLAALCVMAVTGWVTIEERQNALEKIQGEQQKEIHELAARQEMTAELNARQAAIIDGLEMRMARAENQLDWKKVR
jgi:hypothetical protein